MLSSSSDDLFPDCPHFGTSDQTCALPISRGRSRWVPLSGSNSPRSTSTSQALSPHWREPMRSPSRNWPLSGLGGVRWRIMIQESTHPAEPAIAKRVSSDPRPVSLKWWVMYPAAPVAMQMLERSEEHTSELQSRPHLVCRLLLEKKNSYSVMV